MSPPYLLEKLCEKMTFSDASLLINFIHGLLKVWKTVENPTKSRVFTTESVENHVDNVDEWGKHTMHMHMRSIDFIHRRATGNQDSTNFDKERLSNRKIHGIL